MTVDAAGRGVARYRRDDDGALAEFQRRMFGEGSRQTDRRCFAWRFADSPSHPEGDLWIAWRNGAVVGQQAGLPFDLKVGDEIVRAWWAIDLMVDPAWRLRGVGPALSEAFLDDKPLVLGLGITDAAHRAYLRAGWYDCGEVPRYVRVMAPLPKRINGHPAWAANGGIRALAAVAIPMLRTLDLGLASLARLGGVSVATISAFDDRVEEVWQRLSGLHPVIPVRDAQWLHWRFEDAPHRHGYHRLYLHKGGGLVGYAVLRMQELEGLKRCALVDHLCEPDIETGLLAHCLCAAQALGAEVVTCLAPVRGTQTRLRRLGFARRGGARLMVRASGDADRLLPMLWHHARWFLTFADSDLDHPPP